jgi:hypothetical protein
VIAFGTQHSELGRERTATAEVWVLKADGEPNLLMPVEAYSGSSDNP